MVAKPDNTPPLREDRTPAQHEAFDKAQEILSEAIDRIIDECSNIDGREGIEPEDLVFLLSGKAIRGCFSPERYEFRVALTEAIGLATSHVVRGFEEAGAPDKLERGFILLETDQGKLVAVLGDTEPEDIPPELL